MKIHSGPVKCPAEHFSNELRIVAVISEGHVFRILKARRGTKFVILKVPVSPDSMSIGILRREFELGRSLSHPCVVNTIGFETNSPAGPAIVMEFIDGLPLDEFISNGASSSSRKSVMMDILNGVDYLHHRGIIHNDLKPDNIVVNSNGAAHIIDFGLSTSEDSIYKGCVGGSDGFSAPEILNGDGPAGAASDIYSLGLLLRQLCGDGNCSSVIRKCLENNPHKRYQSVADLRNALVFRNRLPVFAAAVSVLVAALAVISLLPGLRDRKNERKMQKLESAYEELLSPQFEAAVARIKTIDNKEEAFDVENQYFEIYLEMLDSIRKQYPSSSNGVNSPEVSAFCSVGRKQQALADSICMSLPFKSQL